MATSRIEITFNRDLQENEIVKYLLSYHNFSTSTTTPLPDVVETWVNTRTQSYQVPIGNATANAGERSAINFAQYVLLDYYNWLPTSGTILGVSRIGNKVKIVLDKEYQFNLTGVTIPAGVTIEVFNYSSLFNFNIQNLIFSTSNTNPCQNVKAEITTSSLATKINQPINNQNNTDNPIIIEVVRGSNFNFNAQSATALTIDYIITPPPLLDVLTFNLTINNSPFGATIIVNNSNTDDVYTTINNGLATLTQIVLEYSLDNITWQSSNEFNGLAVGDYTLYIKDNFGCIVSKTFNVSEFGIQSPYFYISKSNSFRFANRITWGDSENYKNDENTLSCEVDVELAYKEVQQFQSADIIITQFKSNYASKVASVIKNDGSLVNIPIVQKTNNIGIKDKRDARKYDLGNGKTGIYFLSGSTYDYDTNANLNNPYTLNGLLPEWAIVGNYFSIGTTFYLIEDIIFDEIKNAEVIVFTNAYVGPEVNLIVGSIYNRFNYEVFEFTIDMVNYIDEKFRVKLENSDPNFTTLTHLSEEIWCKVKHENVLEIRYKNATNTDIIYSTGIEHKIRIPYIKVFGKSDEQSEVHKTDTNAILLNADLYEADEFQFEPVTKEIWRKIMIALSHETVLLNGVGYVKNGSFNTEGPLERSNLYVLTATMIKTGSVYNSQTSGNLDFDGTAVEVPGLISTESGYVSY